jgi:hypothetical protein
VLEDLIAQAFCRETRRKLRRLGMLGLILSSLLAVYVELPLEISVTTREAQILMVSVQRSIDSSLAHWEHHILDMDRMRRQKAKRGPDVFR